MGLDPGDCFALATYKIYQGLQKHEKERLPYIFAVVGVPELTGERAGIVIPEDLVHLCSFVYSSKISGKRNIEDQIVRHLLDHPQPSELRSALDGFISEIKLAEWRVLSARRADKLLRERLFERVFAVRVRAFASNYRRAEVDMHFSISRDLTRLEDFLKILQHHGLQGLTVRLERGEV